jgi:putative glycosyltransferase (TIGR04372 family)
MRHFLLLQVHKTIRRPARVFRMPLVLGSLALRRLILPLVYSVVSYFDGSSNRLPAFDVVHRQPKMPPWRAKFYFHAGTYLLQQSRTQAAWNCFEKCLRGSTDPVHFFTAAVCLLHGLGRAWDALSCFAHANDLNLHRAGRFSTARTRYRILDNFWVANIGHIASLDYVIKLGNQEGRNADDTILYVAPGSRVANRCLLEQFRPYLKLIEQAADLPFDEAAVPALRYDFVWPRSPNGSTVHFWEVAAKTYRRWYQSGRGALLTLSSQLDARGWQALRSKGVPEGAWFVAVHVREPGSKRHHADLHQVLNADVTSYLPAIAEITRRGGWVIRMGDPNMVPLPALPKMIDYCHSDLRADWMDVFIAARCRFMLGTSSGPAYLPPLYGVPSVLTNWWPPAQRPWHPMDIFVPKMIRNMRDGRLLTLSETLVEPFSFCHAQNYLENVKGVRVEDNAPELIHSAVVEMFEKIEDNTSNDPRICALRRRADDIYNRYSAYGMGQLASGFLQNCGSFIN